MMYQAPQDDRADLQTYLQALRNRFWVVLLVTALFGALGWYLGSSRTLVYEADSRVLVAPTPVGSTRPGVLDAVTLERESEVIKSVRIANEVSGQVNVEPGTLLSGLSVRFVPSSSVLALSYSDEDPQTAANVVNGFATVYERERIAAATAFYDTIIAEQQTQSDDVTEEIRVLDSQVSALNSQRDAIASDPLLDADVRRSEIAKIDADRSAALTAKNLALNQQRSLATAISDSRTEQRTLRPPAEVLELAEAPTSPSSVGTNIFIIGATLLGLILGTALAFVLDRLDSTARDRSDVEQALGASVLVTVPSFGLGFSRTDGTPVMLTDSSGTLVVRAREAFRRLRTSLQFLGASEGLKSILVTSSRPGEGKSQVAANLAVSIAQSGRRVALVSADMRRPSAERILGIEPTETGLATLLAGESDGDVLVEVGEPNLYVLPVGPLPANPGELLGGGLTDQLVTGLEKVVDFVIFDSPPILSTADALSIAPRVDGVLIVIDSRKTETGAIGQVRAEIEGVGGHIVGAVLNRDRQASRRFALRQDPYAYAPK